MRSVRFTLAATVAALFALSMAASAQAAISITGWSATPSTKQAAAHPQVKLAITASTTTADLTGDDIKKLVIDLPAGQLANGEAVPAASRCSATDFAADTCPAASTVGAAGATLRIGTANVDAPGTLYLLADPAGSVFRVGAVLRPQNYKKLQIASTKVAGAVSMDATYGMSLAFDNLPRTIAPNTGTAKNLTFAALNFDLAARAGTGTTGAYFMTNPTRCTTATTRAVVTAYSNSSVTKTSAFTPTGCTSVPFAPNADLTFDNPLPGQTTGVTVNASIPVADQAIQQSHIKSAEARLPAGTSVKTASLNAVPALCTTTKLASDTCPAGSRIGTVGAAVPILPPDMTGEIYLLSRASTAQIGVILRGAAGTFVSTTGTITSPTTGVRITLPSLPQAPYGTAFFQLTSKLVTLPGCGTYSSSVVFGGWSGAAATSATPARPLCGEPDTTITASAPAISNDPTATFSFTSPAAGATFECSVNGGAYAACTSPFTTAALADGSHTFSVRARVGTVVDSTPASASFKVDTTAPAVSITNPAADGDGDVDLAGDRLNITQLTGGAAHNCALSDAGTVRCWGWNAFGQLGDGTQTNRRAPVQVAGLSDVRAIAGGQGTTCVVTNAGGAKCWGWNLRGEVGDGSTAEYRFSPVDVSGLTSGVASIASGDGHTCVVTTVGGVKCWGNAFPGSLGNSAGSSTSNVPVDVVGLSANVASVATGNGSSCALTIAGGVKCWGDNSNGELGDGTQINRTTPVDVVGLSSGVAQISVGNGHACARLSTGAVKCWGLQGAFHSVGDGSTSANVLTPVTVSGLSTGVTAIDSGFYQTCAILTGGSVSCWGDNGYAGIGSSASPVAIPSLSSGVVEVTANGNSQCARLADGSVRCWGDNRYGSVGDGTFAGTFPYPPQTVPQPVIGLRSTAASGNATFSVVDANPGQSECSVDGAPFAVCSSPAPFGPLSEGNHTLTVRATDQAGNSGQATLAIQVTVDHLDLEPPETFISGPGPFTGATPVHTLSSNEAGVSYECSYLNPSIVAPVSNPVSPSSPLAQGSHTLYCRAVDASGNFDWTPASVNFTVDATGPTITGACSPNTNQTASCTFTASDSGSGIDSTQCAVDGGAFQTCASPFVTGTLTPGVHTVLIRAIDRVGNATTITRTVTITGGPPTVQIVSPASYFTSSTTIFSLSFVTTNAVQTTCSIDGGPAVPCTSPRTIALDQLPRAPHSVTVTATSASGSVATATINGHTGLISDPIVIPWDGSSTNTGSIMFQQGLGLPPGSYGCKLDSGAWEPCTIPKVYSGLPDGGHQFRFKTNISDPGEGFVIGFTVDRTAPPLTVTTPANGAVSNNGSIQTTFTTPDDSITTCRIDSGSTTRCSSGASFSGLIAGSHTLTVTARDAANNQTVVTRTFEVNLPVTDANFTYPTQNDYINDPNLVLAFTAISGSTNTCSLDGGTATACTNGQSYPGLSDGAHTVSVTWTNAGGSTTLTRAFTVDTVDPVLTISNPVQGSSIDADAVSVDFTIDETSPYTASCQIGVYVANCSSGRVFDNLFNGPKNLIINVNDAAGNYVTGTVNFTIVNHPGTVVMSNPPSGYVSSPTPSIYFSHPVYYGVTFECRVDGGSWTPCTNPYRPPALSDGPHTVDIRGVANGVPDPAYATASFTVDTVDPETFVSSPPDPITDTTPTFEFSSNEPGTFQCRLDTGFWGTCPASYTTTTLAPGAHVLRVYALDRAFNVDETQEVINFTVVAP